MDDHKRREEPADEVDDLEGLKVPEKDTEEVKGGANLGGFVIGTALGTRSDPPPDRQRRVK